MSNSDSSQNPPPDAKKGQLNIKLDDDTAKGAYANVAIVHNNDAEFVFDFVFMEPQRGQGRVVSRVIANPRTAKRLLLGLNELVSNYEKRFGEIQLPSVPSPKGNYH
jgi:hypothetical protein